MTMFTVGSLQSFERMMQDTSRKGEADRVRVPRYYSRKKDTGRPEKAAERERKENGAQS